MFIHLYRKHFKQKFFNKILIIYTMIIILSIFIIVFFILQNVSIKAYNEAQSYNIQTANAVKDYMVQKNNAVKRIIKQLHTYSAYSDILLMLGKNCDRFSPDFTTDMRIMDEYLMSGASMDNDITSITVEKKLDGTSYYYSQDRSVNPFEMNTDVNKNVHTAVKSKPYGPSILPAFTPDGDNNHMLFPIASNIKESNMVRDLGFLVVTFNTTNFRKAYRMDEYKYNSSVLVLTEKGQVVYDSTKTYYGSQYPYFHQLESPEQKSYSLDTPSIASVIHDPDLNLYIACILPQSQVYKDTVPFRNTVIILSIFCVFAALLLAYISIYFFSRRITAINAAIGKARAGDLSVRVDARKGNDEISQIALNFNDMCEKLNNYIDRVYVAELNQKEADLKRKDAELKQRIADLYSLQSQINPHFLHNTLEAIRMRAVSEGNREVGKMAHILSTIFRNSIKKEMVVRISDEINHCRMYLELYNIRYNENLDVEYVIDDEVLQYGILKHLLQPILENSIIHGINLSRPGNKILINGIKTDGDIIFEIVDNGKGIPEKEIAEIREFLKSPKHPNSESIGILNVNQRIKLVYGSHYGLQINSIEGHGTSVILNIAAKTVKELEEYVQGNAG